MNDEVKTSKTLVFEDLDQTKNDLIKSTKAQSEIENPFFQEITSRDSYLYPESQLRPYNPDDLIQKYPDYSIYTKMCKDDQVSVCLQIKKDLVLASGYDFIATEDGHEEIVEDLKIAISEDPEWSFEEMLEEVISAYEYGFSVSEKVFKIRDDGKLSLKYLKTRHPGTWTLHTDDTGNVSRYEQSTNKGNFDIPKSCLVHYINKRKFQNPYGSSDLRAAYSAWFTKEHISRWYAIFIEKAAGPIPVATYNKQANPDKQAEIHAAISKFQTKTALTIPDYIKVEFLEAKGNGESFIKGINLFNMFIGRSLFIPDLMGFQGSETGGGAYALGKSQLEIFFRHIRRRRVILEQIVNNEVVWPVVLYNYGYVDNYPKFRFRELSKEDAIEAVKLWLEAAKSSFYKPTPQEIDHFRSIVNFPITDAELDELEDPGVEDPIPTNVEIHETEDGGDRFALPGKFQPTSGLYGNKTDFNLIEKQLSGSLDAFLAVSKPLVSSMFKDFLDVIDSKKIIQREKIDKLDSLSLKGTSNLRRVLQKSLIDLYKKGKELASSEIFKSNFAKPIVDDKFLKFIEEETYQFIGDWEYNVTKNARLAIIQAIKDGKSIADVVNILEAGIKEKSNASLDRYARTKFTEVMNKGRLAFFEDTGVVSGYQYSAILDDRTTEICRGLHGKIFKAGNQPIPPMHFNCRSMLIPITVYEPFDPDTKVGKTPIEDFIEEKKGEGFPKQ